jgi:hypothetical protein
MSLIPGPADVVAARERVDAKRAERLAEVAAARHALLVALSDAGLVRSGPPAVVDAEVDDVVDRLNWLGYHVTRLPDSHKPGHEATT